MLYLAVGIGGFIGAIARYFLSTQVQKMWLVNFPIGTLAVNVLGSLVIGFLFAYFEQVVNPYLKLLLVTGLLGALTTFSTFSLETLLMLQDGFYQRAFLNVTLNVILSISATFLGLIIFNKLY